MQFGLFVMAGKTARHRNAWRFDDTFDGLRKTLSLGLYPRVDSRKARERRRHAEKQVALGINPSGERKQARAVISSKVEAHRLANASLPVVESFEEVVRR